MNAVSQVACAQKMYVSMWQVCDGCCCDGYVHLFERASTDFLSQRTQRAARRMGTEEGAIKCLCTNFRAVPRHIIESRACIYSSLVLVCWLLNFVMRRARRPSFCCSHIIIIQQKPALETPLRGLLLLRRRLLLLRFVAISHPTNFVTYGIRAHCCSKSPTSALRLVISQRFNEGDESASRARKGAEYTICHRDERCADRQKEGAAYRTAFSCSPDDVSVGSPRGLGRRAGSLIQKRPCSDAFGCLAGRRRVCVFAIFIFAGSLLKISRSVSS